MNIIYALCELHAPLINKFFGPTYVTRRVFVYIRVGSFG